MERDDWGNPLEPARPAASRSTGGMRKLAGLAILAVGFVAGCTGCVSLLSANRSGPGTLLALGGVAGMIVGLLLTWSAERGD
jgi:hypothetical protein